MRFGVVLLRGAIGALLVGHGTQKLFGWFGGDGLEGTGETFEGVGLYPGRAQAAVAGCAETTGGALLAAGIATPVAAASLSGVMITAIRTVHWRNGPWVTRGGYEYPLVLLASLVALTEAGGRRRRRRRRTLVALAQLAAGALGSQLAIEAGRVLAPTIEVERAEEPPPAEETMPKAA